ncbi:hypothetical protein WDW89_09440 [Deltaproteobacteria bacterium TL4]
MGLILDILPFIVFVLIKRKVGLKEGIFASFAVGIMAIGYHLFHMKSLTDPLFLFVIFALGLLYLMGWISYKKGEEAVFKFQPVVFGSVFGAFILIAFYGFDYAILKEIVISAQNEVPLEMQQAFNSPQFQKVLYYASRNIGAGMILLSGLMAYAALKLSDWWWLALRFFGFYLMLFVAFLNAQSSAM